jgi:hypothetical protein
VADVQASLTGRYLQRVLGARAQGEKVAAGE